MIPISTAIQSELYVDLTENIIYLGKVSYEDIKYFENFIIDRI